MVRAAPPRFHAGFGQPPGELNAVAALVRDHAATVVVLGHPRSMSGDRGPRAQLAESFGEALRAILDVPVELQDERLSTAEAERQLATGGARGRAARERVDASAAAVILQAWLDRRRG